MMIGRSVAAAVLLGLVPAAGAQPQPPSYGIAPGPVRFAVAYPDPAQGLFDPTTRLADLRGRVVMLAFVTPGCAGCDQPFGEAPVSLAGRVTFLQVLSNATPRQARTLGEGRRPGGISNPSPVAADPDGSLARRFGVTSQPTLFVYDRAGTVVARVTGTPGADVVALLRRLVAMPAPTGFPKPRPIQPRGLGVLFDRPGRIGPIPRFVRRLLTRDDPCRIVPGSLRLAARGPRGRRVLIGRGYDGWPVTITIGRGDLGGSVGCGVSRFQRDRDRVLRRVNGTGVFGVETGRSRTRWYASLIVLDGWTEFRVQGRRIPITANGVVIEGTGRPPAQGVLVGPRGSRTVRIAVPALR